MEALFASFAMVAVAEIGDKTQLLSFILAARFRGRHGAVIAGIFAATVLNHLFAALVGGWVAHALGPDLLRWLLALAFFAFAAWALIPDTLEAEPKTGRYGAFGTTLVLFFIAEMGDKTQLATVALGAKYASLTLVTLGTTLGMMAANVPAVLVGESLARRFPLAAMRYVAAALFAVFGLAILLRLDLRI
ncbi:MAG TPA: TMEM165/GDT1 family protein [Tahibacter sp.]|uniref:TMEM165/GDT1 family protein n=1 Tax=Tahibacter sp. TaxID=2056211 RepID=UPI002CBA22E2|nr:TMEM165/GDT1 family protein [Tahibacter sp.]HSX59159.1 TMEM165/GDT1 family protein [Tahibacter sp.]